MILNRRIRMLIAFIMCFCFLGRIMVCSSAVKRIPVAKGAFNYSPKTWNNSMIYKATNCYAYALNFRKNPLNGVPFNLLNNYTGLEPGQLSGLKTYAYDNNGIVRSDIEKKFKSDMKKIGYKVKKINGKDLYKKKDNKKAFLVYLVTTDNFLPYSYYVKEKRISIFEMADYHWYRQDKNGKWSHKRGNLKISQRDSRNKVITNPKKANKNYQHFFTNPQTGNYEFKDKFNKTYYVVAEYSYSKKGVYYMVTRK